MSLIEASESPFGPIPPVVRERTITELEAPPEFTHVTYAGQNQMYFEQMMSLMEAKGLGFLTLLEQGVHASVGKSETEYLRELKAGDTVTITTNIEELPEQLKFDHLMERGGKKVGTEKVVVNVRTVRGFPMPIPQWVSERLRIDIDKPQEEIS